MIKYCKDCHKETKGFGLRCYSCAGRNRGKIYKYKICYNCHKQYIKNPHNTIKLWLKSKFCSNKCRVKFMKGIHATNYKDGRTSKYHYCKCGKKINVKTALRGGTCVNCMAILYKETLKGKNNPFANKKHTLKSKIKMSLTHGGTGVPYAYREHPKEFFYIRDLIRERDNYVCQICNCKESEINRELDIHHIDYNKFNSDKKNLISLCNSCHAKTKFNRDYWYAYFRYLMEN